MNDNINDVIVKTNEGYLFDVYFDEVFSEYFVEYMGQVDPSYIPEVNITYTEASGKIDVTASGNINRITITNNGKEVAGGSNTTLSYTATNSGIYKIAADTKEGLTRYGYVNVGLKKDKLKTPEIKVAEANGNNGWYRTDVNVEIDPTNTNGQTMHYRLTGATAQEDTPVTNMTDTTTIPVTVAGLTKVIAWVEIEEDGKTYRSDYAYYNVKIDNVNPGAPVAKITATEGNEVIGEAQTSTYWYKTNVELEITAEDENSGIYGYTYSITGTKSVSETALIGKTQKITFETDGTYTLIIRAIDKAGNQSTPYTITVYKDSTPPNVFAPNISNITNTGFTISAYTMDDTSGIAKYEYYVNNDKKYEGTENTYTVSGLNKDTTYGVYVNAIDKAGNIQASSAISVYTAGSTSGGTTGGGNTGADGSTIGFGTYTIDYNANGVNVTGLPASRTFAHGETVTLTYDIPKSTQPGYNFYAWSTDPVAQETLYYPGSQITGYGNITLYAIWTDKCTITFNSNGGSTTPAPQQLTQGGSILCPSTAGTNADNPSATLLGWSYEPNSNYVYYLPNGAYNDYNYGNTTLYAVWDMGITLNVDLHGATYTTTHNDIVPRKITYAGELGAKLPTTAGHHPNTNITHWKWAVGDANGSNMGSYWEGTSEYVLKDTSINGKTLHAMWDMQVTYKHDLDTILKIAMQPYQETLILEGSLSTNPDPNKIGCTLQDGWSTTYGDRNRGKKSLAPTDYLGSGRTFTLYPCWDYGWYFSYSYTCTSGREVHSYRLGYYPSTTRLQSNTTFSGTHRNGPGDLVCSIICQGWSTNNPLYAKYVRIYGVTNTPGQGYKGDPAEIVRLAKGTL